jgi:hypothetical protein
MRANKVADSSSYRQREVFCVSWWRAPAHRVQEHPVTDRNSPAGAVARQGLLSIVPAQCGDGLRAY